MAATFDVGATIRGDKLTHVTFADNMSLVARSWLSMKRMLSMLRKALGSRGLALHPSKCKAQTNLQDSRICGDIYVEDGFFVEVLAPGDNLVLLGTYA